MTVARDQPFLDPELLDILAAVAIEQAGLTRVEVATSGEDVEQLLRLRHRAVTELGWSAEAGAELERDHHDDVALRIGAWDGPCLAGTIRVVVPQRGRLLPVEEAFDIVAEPQGKVVDWGRLVVDPRYRGGGHTVMLALLARAWLVGRAHGAEACIGVATAEVLQLYQSLGVEATVLAGPRSYWGEQRYAARLAGVSADAPTRMGLDARGLRVVRASNPGGRTG